MEILVGLMRSVQALALVVAVLVMSSGTERVTTGEVTKDFSHSCGEAPEALTGIVASFLRNVPASGM